tara:strand:- start:6850 stop:7350 length:501 start_codon:yes stop_codon:yes gene_type:complete
MEINIKSDFDSFKRPANPGDAGYDITAYSEPQIEGKKYKPNLYSEINYIEYDTGVSLSPTENQIFTLLYPRSSISKYNLSLANGVGVIDSGYINTIKVRFKYYPQPNDLSVIENKVYFKININKIYKKGDKIAQLIFTYHVHPQLNRVNELNNTTRGLAGFGSTGL